jgi:hypothetical protein
MVILLAEVFLDSLMQVSGIAFTFTSNQHDLLSKNEHHECRSARGNRVRFTGSGDPFTSFYSSETEK